MRGAVLRAVIGGLLMLGADGRANGLQNTQLTDQLHFLAFMIGRWEGTCLSARHTMGRPFVPRLLWLWTVPEVVRCLRRGRRS